MAVDILLFVSKRASLAAAALLCLTAAHLVGATAAAKPALASSSEVRVAIRP